MTELTIHAWIALAIIIASIVAMIQSSKKVPIAVVFMIAATLLVVTGCIDTQTAMKGFASNTILLLVGLFIVISGLENTGFMNIIATRILKKPKSLSAAIVRLTFPICVMTCFILPVATVALFSGIIKNWAKQLDIPVSKLMLPLLYLKKAGSMLLVVGSSPAILIVAQYECATGDNLSLVFPFWGGVAIIIASLLATLAMQRMLPVRKLPEEELESMGNVTELKVPADNPYIGETIGETPAREAFLGENQEQLLGIVRYDGEVVKNALADEFIMGGDTLLLTGPKKNILSKGKGLGLENSLMDNNVSPEMRRRLPIAIIILLAAIIVPLIFSNVSSALGFMSAAMLMVVTGCVKPDKVMKSIKGNIIIIVGCSAAFAGALESTGLSQLLADSIISWSGSSPLAALVIICTLSMILSDILSCYVCPVMLFPVAMSLCTAMGANPLTFVMSMIIACNYAVATPLGDGSKILTFVAGGYKFSDFLKTGVPMNIIILIVDIIISTILFPL